MKNFKEYHEAVAYMQGLSNLPRQYDMRGVHPSLYVKRTRYFLHLLGNPDRGMRMVHITGTGGKGTVAHQVHALLAHARMRVGLFATPYVTAPIETIAVNNQYIAPDEYARLVAHLKQYIDRAYEKSPYGGPSYFEACFALSLLYFRERKCQWAVIEVGMGGRYDATNVIRNPEVTAITNIDYDHTRILGTTLGQIAREKAGIIKRGSVCVTAEGRPRIRAYIKAVCKRAGARYVQVSSDTRDYRELNRAMSARIFEACGFTPDQRVLEHIRLPARFEIVQERPRVIIDGAHNRVKMRSTVAELAAMKYSHLYLVIGFSEDKDYQTMVRMLAPYANGICVTRFQNPMRKCASPADVGAAARRLVRHGARIKIYSDANDALNEALRHAHADDAMCITGSFFLAGELRERWISREWILRNRRSII